jgi:hypothetical protein
METQKLFEAGRMFFIQKFGGDSDLSQFFFKKINDTEIDVKRIIGDVSTKVHVKYNEYSNTIDMVLHYNEYETDSVGFGSTEIPVKRTRIVDYDTLKQVKIGAVIIGSNVIKVKYNFISDDEIYCITIEETEMYQKGYCFYTHYKSLKIFN